MNAAPRVGRLRRWGTSLLGKGKIMADDYATSLKGIAEFCKDHPVKAVRNLSVAYLGFWLFETNTSESEYRSMVTRKKMLLNAAFEKSPKALAYVNRLDEAQQRDLLRYHNFGLFSVVMIDNYPKSLCSYKAFGWKEHNFWLNFFDALFTFSDSFMDVGFAGRFPIMEEQMINYDVDNSDQELIDE